MPYKSFQNSHGHFEDYAIWYHMYFNTYHSKLGLRVTYLTFLRDETLFLRLQCRVSLFGQLRQPRPQGFSLKKWVGPTHFLREKPWGRGCNCESLTDVSKNVTTFALSGLYLGWTRTSSMEEKKNSSLFKLSMAG